uniref:DUS-like FMN-binding domain-containing protein n=1 Tax=Clastoptera arizonana TaxID=38151 RepID=A0A1B6DD26_9HEMI
MLLSLLHRKYCDGVDLNCGCPQRWAIQEGYGCSLLSKPEIVKDLILQARNRISKPFTVSAKIRILPDLRKSIDLCKQLESAGASFLTVHGRTPVQRTEPVNIAALCEIRKSVALPLIANGDVKTLKGAEKLQKDTGYQGVMSARGILQNPALYSGVDITPLSCIETWIKLGIESKMNFHWFHHHLSLMLEKTLPKCERKILTNLKTHADVAEHMSTLLNIKVPKNINF